MVVVCGGLWLVGDGAEERIVWLAPDRPRGASSLISKPNDPTKTQPGIMRGSLRSRKRESEGGENGGNGGAGGGSGRGKDGEGQPSTKRSKQDGPRIKLRTCVYEQRMNGKGV